MTKEEAQALNDKLWQEFGMDRDDHKSGTYRATDHSKLDPMYARYKEINLGLDPDAGPLGLHGAIHQIRYADGAACYQVLEVAHVPQLDQWMARIRRVPGCDDWTVPTVGWEGWVALNSVEYSVRRAHSPLLG